MGQRLGFFGAFGDFLGELGEPCGALVQALLMPSGQCREIRVAARRLLRALRELAGDLEQPSRVVGGGADDLRLLGRAPREILRRRRHLLRRRAHLFGGRRNLRRHRSRFVGGGANGSDQPPQRDDHRVHRRHQLGDLRRFGPMRRHGHREVAAGDTARDRACCQDRLRHEPAQPVREPEQRTDRHDGDEQGAEPDRELGGSRDGKGCARRLTV